jgi:hypothetical protein
MYLTCYGLVEDVDNREVQISLPLPLRLRAQSDVFDISDQMHTKPARGSAW